MKTCNTRVFETKIAVGEFHAILREDFVIKILFDCVAVSFVLCPLTPLNLHYSYCSVTKGLNGCASV